MPKSSGSRAANKQGAVARMHGGKSTGAPKGNKNASKHGRYTADAITRRREIAALLQTMRALARATGAGE